MEKKEEPSTFDKVQKLLKAKGVKIKTLLEHEETKTSEHSANIRGVPLRWGNKAILMKIGKKKKSFFVVAVVPGDCGVDSKKFKKVTKTRNMRFANPEELKEKCNVTKGALPPFGNIFKLKTYVDADVFKNEDVFFNPGSLTHSIRVSSADYKKALDNFEVAEFCRKITRKEKVDSNKTSEK